MPNKGQFADTVRKRIEASKNEAITQKIERVRESVVPAGSPRSDEAIRDQGTGTAGGRGAEVEYCDGCRPTSLGATGNPADRGVYEDKEVVRVLVEGETKPPKVKALHKLARWIGSEGGESAMAEGPAYEWQKSVAKGAKSTGGVALVLMAVLGFLRGVGIELWNPENDEAAVVVVVSATALVSGLWRGVSNWMKHRKSGA